MLSSVSSFAWRVAGFASACESWTDTRLTRLLPWLVPTRFEHTVSRPRVGTTVAIVVLLLLLVRNLLLAAPYVGLTGSTLEAVQQDHGIYDNSEFPEIRAAREAVVVFGGMVLLLVLGSLAGEPPFRRIGEGAPRRTVPANLPASSNPPTSRPDTLLAVHLSGQLEIDGDVRRLHDQRAALEIDNATPGGTALVFHANKAGRAKPIGLWIRPGDVGEIEAGRAYGLFEPRPALRFSVPVGRVTVGFDDQGDRARVKAVLVAGRSGPG